MILVNPNTGKPVDVAEAFVDRLTRAGFKEQEPAVEEQAKQVQSAPKRRSRKSD